MSKVLELNVMIWFYPKSCITLKISILVAYTTYVEYLWVQCFVHIWKSILSSCLFHHQIRYLARFVKSHISWIGNQCHTSIIDHKNNNTIDKLVWRTRKLIPVTKSTLPTSSVGKPSPPYFLLLSAHKGNI